MHLTELKLTDSHRITDASLAEIGAFANLTSLDLSLTAITDAALKHLQTLTKLTTLVLASTKITDAGLHDLGPLKNLHQLNLFDAKITGAGLKDLTSLTVLNLSQAKITHVGFLRNLSNLKTLNLMGCDLTRGMRA